MTHAAYARATNRVLNGRHGTGSFTRRKKTARDFDKGGRNLHTAGLTRVKEIKEFITKTDLTISHAFFVIFIIGSSFLHL